MPRINDYKFTDCVTCNGAGEYVEEIHRSDGTTAAGGSGVVILLIG